MQKLRLAGSNRQILASQGTFLPQPLCGDHHMIAFAAQSGELRCSTQNAVRSLTRATLNFDGETVDADILEKRLQDPGDSLYYNSIPVVQCRCLDDTDAESCICGALFGNNL